MTNWTPGDPIRDSDDYRQSLRGRGLNVYVMGEQVAEPIDHPIVRPSINAMATTYDLAESEPDVAQASSSLSGDRVNRFLHVAESVDDVVAQNRMQRKLGQMTGTCFQRCVGMDAINATYSVTYDIDAERGTDYHSRFKTWLAQIQLKNLVIGGAMTDPKGDRSKAPSQQDDPDLFVRVTERRPDGVVIRGAKAHQTGALNAHWVIVMPTIRLRAADSDYAITCAVPTTASGITYVYGRQSCDTRALESGDVDAGNASFSGQEVLIIFDDVFVPTEQIFMDGEWEYASELVERFTSYHRRSYVCKTGVGDVLIGAAALAADHNGVAGSSHIKDKLVEMAHLNETIYATGIAASHESFRRPAGNFENDGLLANVCKQNVTRFPYEMGRLAQDLAGGLMVTMPSQQDFEDPDVGP
ncbi:MAG: 4-hydroxyphenylacetate 3-hydroxylase N-terminal domain-containing protein, partial [Candidatus Nanopelagicales bacterium]|nr:4-hydroxyphenylacetate 3-hydroxylase N-terminal domain-containing protein [Candidatus Nanopelagicales bacterium]